MRTVTILGGGPSIKTLEITQERFPEVIAVNNSWELAPWAILLYAGDEDWWLPSWGNVQKVKEQFKGRIFVDAEACKHAPEWAETRKRSGVDYSRIDDPKYATGVCSGCKAMSVAYHEGYKCIQLAGFDSAADVNGNTHYHNDHPTGRLTGSWDKWIREGHRNMARLLKARGIELVRITEPGTSEIPYRPLT